MGGRSGIAGPGSPRPRLLSSTVIPHPQKLPDDEWVQIDSQSVKAAETVSRKARGFDGAKLINGRKKHLNVDTKGLLVTVKVTPADVTHRDAARELLSELCKINPELTLMWADNAYTGVLRCPHHISRAGDLSLQRPQKPQQLRHRGGLPAIRPIDRSMWRHSDGITNAISPITRALMPFTSESGVRDKHSA